MGKLDRFGGRWWCFIKVSPECKSFPFFSRLLRLHIYIVSISCRLDYHQKIGCHC